jgi:hypothetical protein
VFYSYLEYGTAIAVSPGGGRCQGSCKKAWNRYMSNSCNLKSMLLLIMIMSYGNSRNNNPECGTLPPEGIRTLTHCWGLCDQMMLGAMLAVALLGARSSHARQVKGGDLDKTGYPGAPGWGLGVGLSTPNFNHSFGKGIKGL